VEAIAFIQADPSGLVLNIPTLAVVTSIVVGLVGGISFLFKKLDSHQARQIERLQEENEILLEKLFDIMQIGERTADIGEEAAKLLLKRKSLRRSEP
jgi:hypothetical protein